MQGSPETTQGAKLAIGAEAAISPTAARDAAAILNITGTQYHYGFEGPTIYATPGAHDGLGDYTGPVFQSAPHEPIL